MNPALAGLVQQDQPVGNCVIAADIRAAVEATLVVRDAVGCAGAAP